MKKVLWTLSALALAGLCFTSCDEETMNNLFGDPEEWSPVSNEDFCDGSCGNAEDGNADAPNCFSNDITKGDDVDYTFCSACSVNCGMKYKGTTPTCVQGDVVLGGGWGCASAGTCAAGQGFKVTGEIAKCEPLDVNQCTATSGCGEGYHCDTTEGICVEDEVEGDKDTYTFVRIDDLMEKCEGGTINSEGLCSLDDPGADIDTIVLVKKDGTPKYVSDIIAYKRADFGKEFKTMAAVQAELDGKINIGAANPEVVKGKPTSFVTYGQANDDHKCVYYNQVGTDGKGIKESGHPYVSLGGKGGYLEVEMEDAIEVDDQLDVLEVGKCEMSQTGDGKPGQFAKADKVKVSVSISGEDGSWVVVNELLEPTDENHGILSTKITADMLK